MSDLASAGSWKSNGSNWVAKQFSQRTEQKIWKQSLKMEGDEFQLDFLYPLADQM